MNVGYACINGNNSFILRATKGPSEKLYYGKQQLDGKLIICMLQVSILGGLLFVCGFLDLYLVGCDFDSTDRKSVV